MPKTKKVSDATDNSLWGRIATQLAPVIVDFIQKELARKAEKARKPKKTKTAKMAKKEPEKSKNTE
jgi:hypothetical protein